jgi:hypothetical protein
LDHNFWIYQILDKKITNINQICKNDKETEFFKNQMGALGRPTRQRGPELARQLARYHGPNPSGAAHSRAWPALGLVFELHGGEVGFSETVYILTLSKNC